MISGASARAHLVHFYDEDRFLVESVARFVAGGLGAGEVVIAIGTPSHLAELEKVLAAHGLHVAGARSAGRYLTFDAAEVLSKITRGGQPDPEAFAGVIGGMIRRAAGSSASPVRVFGEMVALLWEKGEAEAAIRLEELWNELGAELPFALLCAYPIGPFASETHGRSFLRICEEHTEVVPAESYSALDSPAERQRMVAHLQQQASARRAEREMLERAAEATSRLAAIVESSDDAIVGKTLDGVVTSWNRGAERIFGYSAEEMIGQPISRIIPPERQDDFPMILDAVRRGERVDHYETERVRKGGRRIFVSLTVSPIKDASGRIIGVSKIARDVTPRWELDAQREQLIGIAQRAHAEVEAESRAKDEFLAALGHELRNPLAAVRNALESARLDPDTRDRAMAIASRQTRQLGRLVDDLLDVAQIAQGRVRLNWETVSLAQLIAQAVETTRFLLEDHGHTLTLSLPVDEVRIQCDTLRLEQVLVNLLSNAAKYTPRGGHIELRAEPEDGHVVIHVRDDGLGIAPEVLTRIFDPFVQASEDRARARGGLGVGLTVARSFVALHGGTIEARSDGPGTGADFIVRLPSVPAASERHGELALVPDGHEATRTRILLVEDNPDAAEGMAMLLEAFGQRVQIAADGPSALEAARAEVPALMLVDIGLPGMDGYEVARRVRGSPQLRDVVLVALTGYGLEEDRRHSREAGFDHHLTKPVDPPVLRSLVARISAALPDGPMRPAGG